MFRLGEDDQMYMAIKPHLLMSLNNATAAENHNIYLSRLSTKSKLYLQLDFSSNTWDYQR